MDGAAKPPSLCLEVEAFRRYYNDLAPTFRRHAVDLAKVLFSDGVISKEVKESVSSASPDVERGKVLQDAFQQALVESSDPSATMRSLRRAFQQAFGSTYYNDKMKKFVDGECTISLMKAR